MTRHHFSGTLRCAILFAVLGCWTGHAASLGSIATYKGASQCSGAGAGFFTPGEQKVYICTYVTNLMTTDSMNALNSSLENVRS